jgi:hypothetical protein
VRAVRAVAERWEGGGQGGSGHTFWRASPDFLMIRTEVLTEISLRFYSFTHRLIASHLSVMGVPAGLSDHVPMDRYNPYEQRARPSTAPALPKGESRRLVVESPWSQFTSECRRF